VSETPRARFIEHKGRKVLFIDFSGIRARSTAFHAIDEVRALVATQPERSLLTLLGSRAHTSTWIGLGSKLEVLRAASVAAKTGLRPDHPVRSIGVRTCQTAS
jgi:hypothetical protein